MDIALLIISIIGGLLFLLYIFMIIKTSRDDYKAKKLEEQQPNQNGKA
jgi:hypothetical protein